MKDSVNCVPYRQGSSIELQEEVVVVEDCLLLTLNEAIQLRTFEVIPNDVAFVLWLNSKVQVLCNEQVFLDGLGLSILLVHDFDLVGSEYLTESAGVVMEEGLAEVVKVLRGELQEHLELILPEFLVHVLVIVRLVEL